MIDSRKYPAQVFFSDEDEGYIAVAPDLPGCSAFGDTQEEALKELQDAIAAWIGAAGKAGNPIPEPSPAPNQPLPSGKILLRCPKTLHAQLLERADRDGVSLNQYLIFALSGVSYGHLAVEMHHKSMAADVVRSSASAVKLWHRQLVQAPVQKVRAESVFLRGEETLDVRRLPANMPVVLER